LTAGFTALFLLVWRLESGDKASTSPITDAFIWGAVFLTTILLVWREKNQAAAHRQAKAESARFIAAAETSPDAFFILDAVRNSSEDIVDFRFIYVNSHAEELLRSC
jgi:PAS domain-containing protein